MFIAPVSKCCQVPLTDTSFTTGGHQCINEDPACQQAASAIQGVHSSWVTPQVHHSESILLQLDMRRYPDLANSSLHMSLQVLAMARPWQENLLKHNIPQAFQDAGIGMVLNLQVASWQLLMQPIKLHVALD